ncbi:heparinase II/III family protein [Tahibacter amnicola]|uniref:Heparinase II/III family protein n=1 Tax=Tahibacter amnicola TaxID=2976241 RepID=A0ABY6BA07_9GAMM|nr:heparinase II/III family protein [Tahibacter amnicola]UXI66382.1 heparinase II/III family protein [Tahibacter amnicola]
MIGPALRLYHTVRWLRPVQIAGRVWQAVYHPSIPIAPAPRVRAAAGSWLLPAWRKPLMIDATTLRIHAKRCEIISPSQWNDVDQDKLRLYGLHYFDDVTALQAEDRRDWHLQLMHRWVDENAIGHGNGWEPYPISLRSVNWIIWALAGGQLDPLLQSSLAMQLRYLQHHLERHLLGNHLWANGKALAFAGVYFDGAEADRWLEQGLSILRAERREQILPDGGHFERSPMYHAVVLADLLDLLALARAYPGRLPDTDIREWQDTARAMFAWLAVMTHPDGAVAQFNDAALDGAPRLDDLQASAAAIGVQWHPLAEAPLQVLESSGYARMTRGDAVVLTDIGDIGPDYLPGHAHAETLSFELSLRGHRLFVNAGTSCYATGRQREWERSTAAHNTVQVDGADSSEVWSSFRVARRARVFDRGWGNDRETTWLRATHDGYHRLPGRVLHERIWRLTSNGLTICDQLEGSWHTATARLRLAPTLHAASEEQGVAIRAANVHVRWHGVRECRIEDSTWHAGFGQSERCSVLALDLAAATAITDLSWS